MTRGGAAGRGRGRGNNNGGSSDSAKRGGFAGNRANGNQKAKSAGKVKGLAVSVQDKEIGKQLSDMGNFLVRKKELSRSQKDANKLNSDFRETFTKVMSAAVEADIVPKQSNVRTVLAASGSKGEIGVYRIMTTYTLDPALTAKVKAGEKDALEQLGKVRTGNLFSELKPDVSDAPGIVGMKYVDAKNKLQGRPTLLSNFVLGLEDLSEDQKVKEVIKFCEKNRAHLTNGELSAYFGYLVANGSTVDKFGSYAASDKNKRHLEFLQEVNSQTKGGLLMGDVSFKSDSDFASSFVTPDYKEQDSKEPPYNVYMSNVVVGPGRVDVPSATRSFEDVAGGSQVFKNGLVFQKIGNHYYFAFPVGGPFMYISEVAVRFWFAGDMKPLYDAVERISMFATGFHLMPKIRGHYLMVMSQSEPAVAFPVNADFVVVPGDWTPTDRFDKIQTYFADVTTSPEHGFMLTDAVAKLFGYKKGNMTGDAYTVPYPAEFINM